MTYPGFIFWALLIWALASKGPGLLYLTVGSMGIGTLAVIPPQLTAGVSVVPGAVCSLAFVARMLLRRSAVAWMVAAAVDVRRLGLLSMFTLVALVLTAFGPRLFAGTPIILFRGVGQTTLPSALAPASSNFTQPAYLILSVAQVFVFAYLMQSPVFLRQFFNALLIGALVLVVTGLADLVTESLGVQALLVPFRNATYALLVDDSILGNKRVVGLEPEASAYGPVCVAFAAMLALLRPYYPTARQRAWCAAGAVTLLVMGYLSTSSTAFLTLAVFAGVYGVEWGRRLTNPAAYGRKSLGFEVTAVGLAVFMAVLAVVFDPVVLQASFTLIKHMTLEKSGSSSYLERNTWTRTAWRAFWDTDGVGIGVGSSRTSSWLAALFSSTGVLGAGLMLGFIAQALLRRGGADRYFSGVATAMKLAMFVPFTGLMLAGTSPDFGSFLAMIFGAITGLALLGTSRLLRMPDTESSLPSYST